MADKMLLRLSPQQTFLRRTSRILRQAAWIQEDYSGLYRTRADQTISDSHVRQVTIIRNINVCKFCI